MGVRFEIFMKDKTGGRWPSLAPDKNSRPEVKRIPLRVPNVDSATKNGTLY